LKLTGHYSAVLLFALLCFTQSVSAQGRVVINEFMAWSGCTTTSEYIELMNFGPGPMNIGCYVVTNGKYSVTIPANTIIQPKQYFILSGQDILPQSCGNRDSTVHVDLNWTTCNCTNAPVPTTGDGFMKDGGNANEKVVLLDPAMNVIDAVSRDIPVSASFPITTPALSGGCTSHTFDLSTMPISYESINNATGIDNSYSRKVDGDCGWIKTPAISARAPNKTNSTSSATYNFSTLSASECSGTTGSISIRVSATDVNSLFPMTYLLGYDADANGVFNANDQYTSGVDNSSPSIDISNLAYGQYRITVGSSSSCNLKTYDFFIFNCYGMVLPVKLLSFAYQGEENGNPVFRFRVDEASTLKNVVLEGNDGGNYKPVASLYGPFSKNEITITANALFRSYRLRLSNQADVVSYSQEMAVPLQTASVHYWPNPVKDKIFISIDIPAKTTVSYIILNATGGVIKKEERPVNAGKQTISIATDDLAKGFYYLKMTSVSLQQPLFISFLK
jgi:hypothetical protein